LFSIAFTSPLHFEFLPVILQFLYWKSQEIAKLCLYFNFILIFKPSLFSLDYYKIDFYVSEKLRKNYSFG